MLRRLHARCTSNGSELWRHLVHRAARLIDGAAVRRSDRAMCWERLHDRGLLARVRGPR